MTKIDPPLAQALASDPRNAHAVIIVCDTTCAPVEGCLKEMGAQDIQVMDALNMIAVTLNAEQLQAIEALDAVSQIELDAEMGID